ncbi:MAG: tetratricopeptide repeat protein [Candidatus Omnitrophota bacterium]|nr:tetratricopeptide repeat protein [Candidatus Omnitrophota bacterium]
MEKINRGRFAKIGLVCLAILFFLPLFNISYIYAAKDKGIAADSETYREKGYEAQQRGDIDTAIEWYQKAANIKPDFAAPHNDLGILFETKGWLDRAESEYQKALAIDSSYKEVHTNLALLYERKGELEKAAFHWMRRYKLGDAEDPWTQEAKSRLEKLGLLDKTERSGQNAQQRTSIKKALEKEESPKAKTSKPVPKKQKPEAKVKKDSGWTRVGAGKTSPEKKESVDNTTSKALDKELEESLKLAEERLRKEKSSKVIAEGRANSMYSKARDYYSKGEYSKALDAIRLAKQNTPDNKSLLELEEEIKFKMKEERIQDHFKEGMIRYRQKDFAGARKEFEAILSILPE